MLNFRNMQFFPNFTHFYALLFISILLPELAKFVIYKVPFFFRYLLALQKRKCLVLTINKLSKVIIWKHGFEMQLLCLLSQVPGLFTRNMFGSSMTQRRTLQKRIMAWHPPYSTRQGCSSSLTQKNTSSYGQEPQNTPTHLRQLRQLQICENCSQNGRKTFTTLQPPALLQEGP